MIAVIQRVINAGVIINEKDYCRIGPGLLVLVGIRKNDNENNALQLAKKTVDLRIFQDKNEKMNLSIRDINGEILIISQFTLCSDQNKSGNRPSFIFAEESERANELYGYFIKEVRNYYNQDKVYSGVFAAKMKVELVNDGPVTIIMEK